MTLYDICEYARIAATYVVLAEVVWIEYRARNREFKFTKRGIELVSIPHNEAKCGTCKTVFRFTSQDCKDSAGIACPVCARTVYEWREISRQSKSDHVAGRDP